MRRISRKLIAIGSVALACTVGVCAQVATENLVKPEPPVIGPGLSSQERLERECSSAIRFHKICDISFARLIAQPEAYHGRVVSIVGFLAIDNGDLTLYASEGDYERQVDGASVRVLVPDPIGARSIQEKLYGYVDVDGFFDANAFTSDHPRLGEITAIGGLGTMTRRPVREREIYIHVEDLGLDDEDEK